MVLIAFNRNNQRDAFLEMRRRKEGRNNLHSSITKIFLSLSRKTFISTEANNNRDYLFILFFNYKNSFYISKINPPIISVPDRETHYLTWDIKHGHARWKISFPFIILESEKVIQKFKSLYYLLSQRFVKRVWNAETREKKKNKINVTINETIEARPGYVNLSVIRSRRLTLFESSQRNVCIYIYVP